ncbi:hypothetical protein EV368DRAFT_69911, partial [Lentinula lateritia]
LVLLHLHRRAVFLHTSAADPEVTCRLDNEFGDVHYNASNSRYWVKSEAGWRVQTPNIAFVHPGSGHHKLTWDQNNKWWRDHYQNSERISEHPEGIVWLNLRMQERKRRVSKRKRLSGDESGGEDNAMTRLDKGKGQQIEPLQYPEAAPRVNQNDLQSGVHRYWSSQNCRNPVVEEVAIEILDLVKDLPLVWPNDSRILRIAPSYESGEFHESYLFQDVIALAADEMSVANQGSADRASIMELEPKALSSGFRDLEFDWADRSSPGTIFDPHIPLFEPGVYKGARLVNCLFSERWGWLVDYWQGQQREWRKLEGEIGEGLDGEVSRRQLKDAMAYHKNWNNQSVAEFKTWKDVILDKDGNSWKRIAHLEQDVTRKKEMNEWIRNLYQACKYVKKPDFTE